MIGILWKIAGTVILSIVMLIVAVFLCFASAYARLTPFALLPAGVALVAAIYCFMKARYYKLYKTQIFDERKDAQTRANALQYLKNEGAIEPAEAAAILAQINRAP